MSALQETISNEIRSSGPITFARYMELALYHPHLGYYASGAQRTGFRGHFLTSPELDTAFGALWTRAFEEVWDACGAPPAFDLIELGPGEGSFARAVIDAAEGAFRDALRFTLVERIPALHTRQRALLVDDPKVRWMRSLDELAETPVAAGCVFANEVLDNLPVHLVQRRGSELVELVVNENLTFDAVPAPKTLADYLEANALHLADGGGAEVGLEAVALVARAAGLLKRGAVIFVDYGDDSAGLATRAGGTLLCYHDAGTDDLVLEQPGRKDITSHVNWTAVGHALRAAGMATAPPVSQRTVLKELGLDELDTELRDQAQTAGSTGDGAAAIRALSRRGALGVLADPSGLGGLGVLCGWTSVGAPRFASA